MANDGSDSDSGNEQPDVDFVSTSMHAAEKVVNSVEDVCEQLESWKFNRGRKQQSGQIREATLVRRSSDEDASRIYGRDNDGDTLLHVAIIMQSVSIAVGFLELTPDSSYLNIANVLFQTPLHLAVLTNQLELVRRLVIGGAEVDRQDREGNTPLHIACRDGMVNFVKALLAPITYQEISTNVCSYNTPYQRIPQDLEIRNYEGQTCLYLASNGNHLGIVDLLLENGADVNTSETKCGRTVCHLAADTENHVLLQRLLRHPNIDVNAETYSGHTPIDLARAQGDYISFEKLAEAGAFLKNENG